MEETVIVIMLKDAQTGFLEKELGSFSLTENGELLFNLSVEEVAGVPTVVLRLTCDRELADWEYDAVFDYYDMETVGALVDSIAEEDGAYEPIWVVRFAYAEDRVEKEINRILQAHRRELLSVYEAIKDKEDDYRAE